MNEALEPLLTGLNAALKAQIHPDTGLFDPLNAKPSPSDHYGHVCAALALACSGVEDWKTGRIALQAWLDLDDHSIGHLPFNRLALLLLREIRGKGDAAPEDVQLIDTGLRRCKLRRSYPSNNWSLLAQTCRLIEAPEHKRARESHRLCKQLEQWTTPKGCFIDFPKRPRKRFSTPLAYHHKALFLTALACWFHDHPELVRHARRLCDWLVHCWDPAGYAGGFGRSTHSLFGDGCLIAGLILLGIDGKDPKPIAALAHRLAQQRRSDGLLWLNPAGHESGTASWDSYMHLSVYNAWSAGVITAALALTQQRPAPAHTAHIAWTSSRHGLFHDEHAGLACLRTESDLVAVVSTFGQPPQSFSREHVELRYAGATILHLRKGSRELLLAPALRVTHHDLDNTPALAGWTPTLLIDKTPYGLDLFDSCELQRQNDAFQLCLSGHPRPLVNAPPKGPIERILAILDWRILKGRLSRRSAVSRRGLTSIKGRILIELADEDGQLTLLHQLEIRAATRITIANPAGGVLAEALLPQISKDKRPASHHEISSSFPSSIPGCSAFARPPETLDASDRWITEQKLILTLSSAALPNQGAVISET